MRSIFLGLSFLLSLAATGCGGADYKVYPVTGIVTLDGIALEGATVTLMPTGANGKAASGRTDKAGVYSIMDSRPEAMLGAEPGDYKVGVLWYKAPAEDLSRASGSSEIKEDKAARSKPTGPETNLPPIYTNPETSGLTITVKAETNKQDITLSSKGSKK